MPTFGKVLVTIAAQSLARVHVCRHPEAMLCVLWLGSSVGNLKPHEAVSFFQSVLESAGHLTQVIYAAADQQCMHCCRRNMYPSI